MAEATGRARRKRPGPYHHGDLRAALIAGARRLIELEEPDGVSLRRVAAAAGVSTAAPYHHFADKHALLAAVAADGFRELTRALITAAEGIESPRERLNRLGAAYVLFAVRHPRLFRLMQGPAFQMGASPEELIAARQASYRPLEATVAACLPQADERAIRDACAAAWSLVHGMATLCNDGRLAAIIELDDLEKVALSITRQLDVSAALQSLEKEQC